MWCAWSPATSAALGAGGLVRAYTQSAKDALDAAGISVVRRWVEILLPCSYAQYERVKLETEGFGGVIAEADYGADIALTVLLPEERSEDYLAHMLDITAGTVEGMVCGERFQDVPWRAPIGEKDDRQAASGGRTAGLWPGPQTGPLPHGVL